MAAIDPMTLSPVGAWDVNRSTLFQNSGGTGAPAVASVVGYISDRSGNARTLTDDGTRTKPVLRTDATLSKNYIEYTAAGHQRLITPSFTQAEAFTVFMVVRPRAWAADSYLCSSRADYAAAILQKGSTPQVAIYSGAAAAVANQSAALNSWHVLTAVMTNSNGNLAVDGTAILGNPGTKGIAGGFALGGGPDSDPTARVGDMDFMSVYLFAGVMTPGNIAGVEAYLGQDLGRAVPATTGGAMMGSSLSMGLGLTSMRMSAGGAATADIQNLIQFYNFMAGATAGQSATVLPGLDLGAVDLSSSPRAIGSTPIKLLPMSSGAAKWKFSTTGSAVPALKLGSGWSGVLMDGVEFAHNEIGFADNPGYIVDLRSTNFVTLTHFYVHGANLTHYQNNPSADLRGIGAGDDCLFQYGKIEKVTTGIWNNGSRAKYYDLRIQYTEEDGIKGGSNSPTTIDIDRYIFTKHVPPSSGYHGDACQFSVLDGSTVVTDMRWGAVLVDMLDVDTGTATPSLTSPSQGLYADNETSPTVNTAFVGVTVGKGVLRSVLFLNTNQLSLNIFYASGTVVVNGVSVFQQSDGPTTNPGKLGIYGTVASIGNCEGFLDTGASTITDLGGNVNSGATLSLPGATLRGYRDAWLATYGANIPA